MEAGVAALIADVVWYMSHMIVKKKETLPILMIPAVFTANFIFNVNALSAILGGIAVFLLLEKLKFRINLKKELPDV
jgi:hypothetical protein